MSDSCQSSSPSASTYSQHSLLPSAPIAHVRMPIHFPSELFILIRPVLLSRSKPLHYPSSPHFVSTQPSMTHSETHWLRETSLRKGAICYAHLQESARASQHLALLFEVAECYQVGIRKCGSLQLLVSFPSSVSVHRLPFCYLQHAGSNFLIAIPTHSSLQYYSTQP